MNYENDPLKRYLINYKYLKYKYDKIFTIGITGSCGKTSTALYIYYFLKKHKKNICYIGTHKILYNDLIIETKNTTLEINELTKIFIKNKIKPKMIVMEVSSHGINQGRINCFNFNILALTNLGSDHLDYHLNLNNYHNVKLSFLNNSLSKYIFINKKYINNYNYNNKNIVFFDLNKDIIKKLNTISFNKENMFLAFLILRKLGYKKANILSYLNNINLNNGRIQIIKDNNRNIVIDYAHHIESFKAILDNNNYNKVVIFGCGGNRDKSKRSIMGKIASYYCKYVILTKDNSRDEKIDDILNDISKEIKDYLIIKDREKAINFAINTYNDIDIYILGKGEEKYIIENNKYIPFNDFDCVKKILSLKK